MTPRSLLTACLLLLVTLAMSGCSNCGWIWEDWINPPQKSCHSDRPPEQK
jgi:hypothetical protein